VTIYARGYRGYAEKGEGLRGRPRFLTIASEGSRTARRGLAFRILATVIVVTTTVLSFLLYFQSGPLRSALQRGRSGGFGQPPEYYLEAAIVRFHEYTAVFVLLLTLFVGAGLVADDLRSRALPLYLSRPLRPLDYWLGKLLVPVSVLALSVLVPCLFLVLLTGLLQPTEETLPFLSRQGPLVVAILGHFAVTALAYSSVVLFFSATTSRRITAVVLGAVVFLGGEVVRPTVRRIEADWVDPVRALSLVGDTRVVLFRLLGRDASAIAYSGSYASLGAALVALGVVVALGAWAVVSRARSVEVTS
jgi:ABC-type transport system involved in multi-copper enzyme maturation permease subunit